MSAQRAYSRYEYETSPRKVNPVPKPAIKPKQKSTVQNKKQEEIKKAKRIETRKRAKVVLYLCVGFVILFAIGYRNSQINETFSKKQKLEKQISALKKQNEQLEVSIQNSLNLNQLEKEAKEHLGMQKLTNKQTVYIDLPKKDYVEAGTEKIIIIEEKESLIDSILNTIKNIFK